MGSPPRPPAGTWGSPPESYLDPIFLFHTGDEEISNNNSDQINFKNSSTDFFIIFAKLTIIIFLENKSSSLFHIFFWHLLRKIVFKKVYYLLYKRDHHLIYFLDVTSAAPAVIIPTKHCCPHYGIIHYSQGVIALSLYVVAIFCFLYFQDSAPFFSFSYLKRKKQFKDRFYLFSFN